MDVARREAFVRQNLDFQRVDIISDPKDLDDVWRQQYDRLTARFAACLSFKKGKLAEIGCGKGQLTIPLAKAVRGYRVFAVDSFSGMKGFTGLQGLRALRSSLAKQRLEGRVSVVVSDHQRWLSRQSAGEYDAVVSSEFLPEIDPAEMRTFFSECLRVLRSSGVTIHSFLSPIAKNRRQRLLIEADSDPKWTRFPPKQWFSPRPDLVVDYLRESGFRRARRLEIKSNLRIRARAAQKQLRDWDVKEIFWKKHEARLVLEGLEIPDWVIGLGYK